MEGVFNRALSQFVNSDALGAVLRGAAVALFIRVLAAGAGFFSVVILARWMGPQEFGLYSFAWTWATILAIPAGLGLAGAAIRFIPQYAQSGDWPKIRGLLHRSIRLALVSGLVLSAAGIVAVFLLQGYLATRYVIPLTLALLAIPVMALVTLKSEVARGFGWVGLAYTGPQLGQPLLLLAMALLMLWAGEALTATRIVIAAILAYLIVLLIQEWVLGGRLNERRHIRPSYDTRLWLRVGFPLLLLNGFQIILTQSDLVMVGVFRSPEEVAFYNAAVRTAQLVTFVLQAMNALGAPTYAALHAQKRHNDLQLLLSRQAHWIFWPSLSATLILIVFGKPILALFGPTFQAGYPALIILAVGQLINAGAGPVGFLLNMTGHQDICAKILGCSVVINLVLNVLLIPNFGLVGAAMATAATMSLWNIWLGVLVVRRLGVYPSIVSTWWSPTAKSQ